MRIACIGDGKMGRAVAAVARDGGHVVSVMLGAVENAGGRAITRERLGADVAIEFTEPESALANILACITARIPVVVGTTGWHAHLPEIRTAVAAGDGAVLYAANFSLGVNVFLAAAAHLALLMRRVPSADVAIVETHHSGKKDAPSGTAIALADAVRNGGGRTTPIASVRVGSAPGEHTLVYDGPFEQLRLTHETRDRRVFADGAVRAAEWLIGRQGLFTIRDMLQLEDSR